MGKDGRSRVKLFSVTCRLCKLPFIFSSRSYAGIRKYGWSWNRSHPLCPECYTAFFRAMREEGIKEAYKKYMGY
jgi:hypothetical protein